MMLYAVTEILLFLLVAALIGGLIGWYLRGSRLRESLLSEWSSTLSQVEAERDSAIQSASAARADLDAAMNQLTAAQAAHVEADKVAQTAEKHKAEAQAKLVATEKSADAKAAENKRLKTRNAELQKALEACQANAVSVPPARATDGAEAARSKVAAIAKRTAAGATLADDDLKRIKGVGPKIESLLKEMGISSFRQIAAFTNDDIAVVAAALKSFPDRMLRDDWKGQAARLHKGSSD